MVIKKVNLDIVIGVTSAIPQTELPEVAFAGKSNVGKSSLINALMNRKSYARTSSQPGKTQTINFYELGARLDGEEDRRDFYLVDLPGYGYAKTGKERRKIWSKFIEEYLLHSEDLQFVCQLIDIRHDPMASDVEMFHWLVDNHLPVLLVATKADKISRGARDKSVSNIKKKLGVPEVDVLPYSSLKNEGRSELLDVIGSVLVK